ncbi:MAG: DUF3843 family protein [Planctomycetes bacterium]|nr:DUF3843 family protein [Planctomycetota bacterium]MBL7146647.1 DUF3843 family protein [Phycisphaerae bacterium]
MRYLEYKLHGYQCGVDEHLSEIVQELHNLLCKTVKNLSNHQMHLNADILEDMAGVLVDFASDIHTDTGIWDCYERYNVEFFGNPLPLTLKHSSAPPLNGIHLERIRHLLWVLYQEFSDIQVICPLDGDILCLAKVVQNFLKNSFKLLPQDCGIKKFLKTTNDYGWDVKKKLIWLGTKSYMFRLFFRRYMASQEAAISDIPHTDDFICQKCTMWSGLGAIDILAGIIDVNENDRKCLRNWYERHVAPYIVLSANYKILNAKNTINNQQYQIRLNMKNHSFTPGLLVMGSLVQWRGEWYWSGTQKTIEHPSTKLIDDLNSKMRRRNPSIVYRYDREYEMKARKRMPELHAAAMAFYGSDLMIYSDGLSMAADWQKELRRNWESKPQEAVSKAIKQHGLKNNRADISIPKDLLESKEGLGVFLNPDSGKEIMDGFDFIQAGFRCNGVGLTENEKDAVRDFVQSSNISPRFVKRMTDEYGDDSIKSSFHLNETQDSYWLDYLLRCYKGSFFRKRYPAFSLV